MIFKKQNIEGVFIIAPEAYSDKRGLLRRHFCQREYYETGIMSEVKQCNVSENTHQYTIRGFHYQLPPYGEDKTLSCMNGAIYDVVIDIRKQSKTFLHCESFNLTKENRLSLFVPKGCANAYLTLEDNTWIFYYHSEFYTPGAERGICYNDPFFKINWPAEPEVISDKDLNHPPFDPDLFLK